MGIEKTPGRRRRDTKAAKRYLRYSGRASFAGGRQASLQGEDGEMTVRFVDPKTLGRIAPEKENLEHE